MSEKKNKFDQLNVVSPCSVSWERMSGNHQQRFCGECGKTVYDFARMTRGQIEAVTFAQKGRLCARVTRRDDGTLVMIEPLPPATARRASPLAGAVVSAILGISVPAAAQPATPLAVAALLQSGQDAKKPGAKKPAEGETSSVSGVIRDPQGAVISGATITLNAVEAKPRAATSSDDGAFEFSAVAPGVYTLMVQAAGFKASVFADVTVLSAQATQVDATLQIGAMAMSGVMITPPSTLLRLHRESDLIAIVTAGKSRLVKTENESKQFLTALNVSTVLKGDSAQRVIPLYHWVNEQELDDETQGKNDDRIKPGDAVLVFLDRRKSDDGKAADGFELSDWSRAVKKLDDAALAVYRQRIEELTPILQRNQADQAELIEWLVRCIEEPATRWDGALELGRLIPFLPPPGATKAKLALDRELIAAVGAQSAPKTLETDEGSQDEDDEEGPDSQLSPMLNEGQKARVANALFSIQELEADDMELVELVRELDDKRLAPYLAAQLRRPIPQAPPLADMLVTTIAEVIEDEELEKAAEHYRENSEPDQDDAEEEQDNTSLKTKTPSIAAQIATAKRSALLSQFLALVEQKLNR